MRASWSKYYRLWTILTLRPKRSVASHVAKDPRLPCGREKRPAQGKVSKGPPAQVGDLTAIVSHGQAGVPGFLQGRIRGGLDTRQVTRRIKLLGAIDVLRTGHRDGMVPGSAAPGDQAVVDLPLFKGLWATG